MKEEIFHYIHMEIQKTEMIQVIEVRREECVLSLVAERMYPPFSGLDGGGGRIATAQPYFQVG